MRQAGWTVDAGPSNVASRSKPAGGRGPAQGGITGMAEPARARPKPTPETQHFWDGTQA
ncbi:MAG TPA: DNA-binding protein, partial [Bradyrhizobium sp.]|nr:DNA-binding protein [Bradyrhizobium sp.]